MKFLSKWEPRGGGEFCVDRIYCAFGSKVLFLSLLSSLSPYEDSHMQRSCGNPELKTLLHDYYLVSSPLIDWIFLNRMQNVSKACPFRYMHGLGKYHDFNFLRPWDGILMPYQNCCSIDIEYFCCIDHNSWDVIIFVPGFKLCL